METVAEHNARLMHQAAVGRTSNGTRPTPLVITGIISELDEEELALAHIVDWPNFWATDKTEEDWLARPLIPRGRGIALYAPAKAGKSSVALVVVAALATGRPIFGHWPCQPTSVLYLDYEMTEADLQERLLEIGYSDTDDLTNLHYALLPSLPPLDTAEGAQAVLKLAVRYDAQLIVVDTFGRAVKGEENEADTVRDFYRHTGLALKSAGRTVLRNDHSGKDLDKGQRGTSAKADDVDVVWRLSRTQDGVTLKRTHSRMAWVPEIVNLQRVETDSGITWRLVEEAYPDGTKAVAELLDTLDVPVSASARQAQKALRESKNGRRMTLVIAAQRWRQEVAMGSFGSGNTPGNTPRENNGKHQRETEAKPLQETPGKHPETPSESPWETPPLSYKEAVVPGTTSPDPPHDLFGEEPPA